MDRPGRGRRGDKNVGPVPTLGWTLSIGLSNSHLVPSFASFKKTTPQQLVNAIFEKFRFSLYTLHLFYSL
ncbi:uncharacterized protein CELE_T06E8.2 [Caenorhabditis elegans]|uniref:Uncharacterized protein n=1 Tax=Caenorhabditis elegans TaxID=6239 RepID=Q22266_CAEEL|nr:Uncharacterized protein CELE_T06E8.2 [Caenorhabditis elegans]CAA98275.2 Uncharacterized protein CELE_T06E8.2 [Caenorhabditis elegans]|eukprot:NP_505579.2 Uncharacterized protein CELE_T06E8.2 [Caenorhabditis elegans]